MAPAGPIEQLNALMCGDGRQAPAEPRWQRYFEPVPGLSRGLPAPILGIMVLIWQLREDDLQRRYPLDTERGRLDFIAWCAAYGQREYRALDDAARLWHALDRPARFPGSAPGPDDAAHALSWRMVMTARARVDLDFDLGSAAGRAQLLGWYLGHGHAEHGPAGQPLAPWQIDHLLGAAPTPGLNRVQELFYMARPDLRAAFPLPGALAGYLAWFEHFIRVDTRIADLLRPAPPAPGASAWAASPSPAPDGVNVVGHAFGQLGIGEDARMALKAIRTTTVPALLLDFPAGANIPQGDRSMAAHVAPAPRYDVNMFCLTAPEHGRCFAERGGALFSGRLNIGYWPWELAAWPPEWRHLFALTDEVWVSSEHTHGALAAVSPVPVRLMPMAVEIPKVGKRARADFGLPEGACLFLFAFDLNSSARRKNPRACVAAFLQAFPRKGRGALAADAVGLVIKVHPPTGPNRDWDELKALRENDPRIHLIEATLSKPELLALYSVCDCFVSLHRAEGFGRCIAEAMLLGRPVLATAYSGNLGFTTPDNAFLVGHAPIRLNEGDYPHGAGQVWAEPSVADAARHMREVFQQPALAAARAARGMATIKARHSAKAVGARYADALADLRRAAADTVQGRERRFYICDQAATGPGGHYLHYTRCVARAARGRGFRVELLCNAELEQQWPPLAGVHCHPVYAAPWRGADAALLPAYGAGHVVFDTLAALDRDGADGADHVLLATLSLAEMRAWIAYFVALPLYQFTRLPVYHLLLRFDPAALEQDRSPEWARLRRRLGERGGAMGARLNWCCDTRQLADRYARQLGIDVAVVPIPFDQRAMLRALRDGGPPGAGPVTVLYLGDARPEKGFEAFPAMVAALWESHLAPGKLRFVFQSNLNVAGGQGDTLAALARLAAYPPSMVELVAGPMTPGDYARRLAACDVVLLPYSPLRYSARSSGILIEALAAGKPVLTSRDSWMASQVDAEQAELVDGPAALADGLLRLLARLPAARRAAQAGAPRWRAFASPAGFVRRLLALAPRRAPASAPLALCVLDGAALAQRGGDAQAALARLRHLFARRWRVAVVLVPAPAGVAWEASAQQALAEFALDSLDPLAPDAAGARWPPTRALPDLLLFDRARDLALRDRLGLDRVATVCAVSGADLAALADEAEARAWLARCRRLLASTPAVKAALGREVPDAPCSLLPAAFEPVRLGPALLAGAVGLTALLDSCAPDDAGAGGADRLAAFGDRLDLLYVGSASAANVAGLRWFIDAVYLPRLAPAGITLLVAGTICTAARWPACSTLALAGPVRALAPLYAAAKLCVLPVTVEGGANVKTAQALAYGKPVVGTGMAFAALEPALAAGVVGADSAECFADAVLRLLGQPATRRRYARQLCAARSGARGAAGFAAAMDAALPRRRAAAAAPWPTPSPVEWEPATGRANACLLAWVAPPGGAPAAPGGNAARADVPALALRRAVRALLPSVLACDAVGGVPEPAARRLLAPAAKTVAMLLEMAAPPLAAGLRDGVLRARLVVHGAVPATLLVELRAEGGAPPGPPALSVSLDGARIDLKPLAIGPGKLLGRHALALDPALPFLRVVPLEISLPPGTGWRIATVLLKEKIGLAALRAGAGPRDFHDTETAADGLPFAWTARPAIGLDLPCARGVDKLLVLETCGLAGNAVADVSLALAGRVHRLDPRPAAGATWLCASLGADRAAPFGARATLHAPHLERASASDRRLIGLALRSISLIAKLV